MLLPDTNAFLHGYICGFSFLTRPRQTKIEREPLSGSRSID
jgi:hypothetical protein